MKRILPVIIVFAPFLTQAAQLEIPPPTSMATDFEGTQLRNDLVTDAQNVLFDGELGTKKPDGYTRVNQVSFGSNPVIEMGNYTSPAGNEYLMVVASHSLAYDLGNGTFTIVLSTVDPATPLDCINALGRFVCSSSSQAFYFNGGNRVVDVVTSPVHFPLGGVIEGHANRVWVASGSILYGSKFLDMETWTLGGNAGDPLAIPVGLNDGGDITCLKSFGDGLVIGKKDPDSMWVLIGKSQLDFVFKNLSQTIGCIQDKSMEDHNGHLHWLSKRGIEKMVDGNISDEGPFTAPIQDIMDKVVTGFRAQEQSVSDDLESDFEMGSSTFASVSQVPDSLVISSPTVDYSTPTQTSDVRWWRGSGSFDLRQAAIAFRFTPDMNTNLVGFKSYLKWLNDGAAGDNGAKFVAQLRSNTVSGVPSNVVLSTGAQLINLVGFATGGSPEARDTFTLFLATFTNHLVGGSTYWVVLTTPTTPPDWNWGGDAYYNESTDTFLSVAFATTSDIVDADSDSSLWAMSSASAALFSVLYSSARFDSQVFDLGTDLTRLGDFSASFSLNDGALTFFSRGAGTKDGVGDVTWSPQTVNSSATVNNSRFVQWRADFSIRLATQNPILDVVTIKYISGTKQRVASWVSDGRYNLACSTDTGASAYNNTVIIVDKFDNFTKLNGVNSTAYAEAFGNSYFGSSLSTGAESGLVYKFTPGVFSYNGKPIDSFIRTKDFCGEKGCYNRKDWKTLYVKTRNDGSSGGLVTVRRRLNKGSYSDMGDVSLGLSSGFISAKVPFPVGTQGRSLGFEFGNNQEGKDFRFFGAMVDYDDLPLD